LTVRSPSVHVPAAAALISVVTRGNDATRTPRDSHGCSEQALL
jgi:hypothetical protein